MLKTLMNKIIQQFTFITYLVIAKGYTAFRKGLHFLPITNISKKSVIIFYIIIFGAIFIYILANLNTVHCVENLSNFFERQHNLRVEIVNDLIINTSQKDILIAIHKVVNAKVALLREDVIISNDIDLTPLIKEREYSVGVLKRFFFWIFCIIIALFLDGSITFATYLFNDTTLLQELILKKFALISSHYDLVDDVYKVLKNLELFK